MKYENSPSGPPNRHSGLDPGSKPAPYLIRGLGQALESSDLELAPGKPLDSGLRRNDGSGSLFSWFLCGRQSTGCRWMSGLTCRTGPMPGVDGVVATSFGRDASSLSSAPTGGWADGLPSASHHLVTARFGFGVRGTLPTNTKRCLLLPADRMIQVSPSGAVLRMLAGRSVRYRKLYMRSPRFLGRLTFNSDAKATISSRSKSTLRSSGWYLAWKIASMMAA